MLELTIILLFFTILLVVVGLYHSRPQTAMKRRLDSIVATETGKSLDEELSLPFLQRVLVPISERVASLFRNYMPAEATQRAQKRLIMANLESRLTTAQLHGFCWLSGAGCTVLLFLLLLTTGTASGPEDTLRSGKVLLYMLMGAAGGYILPQFILSRRIQKRQEAILQTMPYALDLLTITVEAGLGFDAALAYALRKMRGPLAEEFAKSLNEIRLGKPRLESLEDLGTRTGVEDLKIFITAVVHASRLGSSITTTLRVQADSLRTRRRQRAQEMAMKAPIKMTFPLVFLIFPALFAVVLGPGMLNINKIFGFWQ